MTYHGTIPRVPLGHVEWDYARTTSRHEHTNGPRGLRDKGMKSDGERDPKVLKNSLFAYSGNGFEIHPDLLQVREPVFEGRVAQADGVLGLNGPHRRTLGPVIDLSVSLGSPGIVTDDILDICLPS